MNCTDYTDDGYNTSFYIIPLLLLGTLFNTLYLHKTIVRINKLINDKPPTYYTS